MADHVYELQSNGLFHFLGNYDDYVSKKQEERENSANQTSSLTKIHAIPPAITTYESEKLAKREERQRQRRLEQLELTITALENEVSSIETQLADPIIYNNYVTVQQLQANIEEIKTQLAQYYEEWETLLA
jgi:ATP-binding cassette subfamily F protein 3